MSMNEAKARSAGLAAAIAAICDQADLIARREWRLFCGAPLKSDRLQGVR
jgi:hypothetical protein